MLFSEVLSRRLLVCWVLCLRCTCYQRGSVFSIMSEQIFHLLSSSSVTFLGQGWSFSIWCLLALHPHFLILQPSAQNSHHYCLLQSFLPPSFHHQLRHSTTAPILVLLIHLALVSWNWSGQHRGMRKRRELSFYWMRRKMVAWAKS